MFSNDTRIGAANGAVTFPDIIINNTQSVIAGMTQGFSSFIHDAKELHNMVTSFTKSQPPRKFADAVVTRRIETQQLDDIWSFPLNMAVPNTCPIPWTLVEASCKTRNSSTSYEFNLMRTVDFIGRNYLRIILPEVDCSQIADSTAKTNTDKIMSDANHMYLGAWHSDLIPRIIDKVVFYPRSNTHRLFEYTGYDIYVHNILFGNAHKEMNDLMGGEDKFDLRYDPYCVDGTAMGLASFKGIDAYREYDVDPAVPAKGGFMEYRALTAKDTVSGSTDGIIDYFQLDTTMDAEEFRDIYRRNVWYEAPVAKNYYARHSIHSRRMYHQKKDITIPLDILPFGYSVASSLPSAALAGECGFIQILLHSDWLDRAFYLTKLSDIPAKFPLLNHTHAKVGDTTPEGDTMDEGDPRIDWVNENSLGRFGDPSFSPTAKPTDEGFDSDHKFSRSGNILGASNAMHQRENIVPTTVTFNDVPSGAGLYRGHGGIAARGKAGLKSSGIFSGAIRRSTTNDLSASARNERLTDGIGNQTYIHKLSEIDRSLYTQIKEEIGVKLLQVGYMSLPCIRDFLSKLPNIYITTEWDDYTFPINEGQFTVNNNLYIQAVVLWFIPTDANNTESLRVYPCHLIDHELPIMAGLELKNDQAMGNTVYDWPTLNVLNPAQMGLNPLIENMGLISFSPTLTANTFPHAFYDSNLSGVLKGTFKNGQGANFLVNLKAGVCKLISIGINGVASVNLNLFKLVF